jgi:cell division protein FtsB
MTTLRRQVASELRTRDYVILTVLLLVLVYLASAAFFGDMGVLRYSDLKRNKLQIEHELASITKDNGRLHSDIDALKTDEFYVEKNARENFGLPTRTSTSSSTSSNPV